MRELQKLIMLLLIVVQLIQTEAQCLNLICQSTNEANQGNCFGVDEKNSQIKMYKNSCEKCQILLSNIINEDGTLNTKGLQSYDNCQNKSNSNKKYSGEDCDKNDDCYSDDCKSSESKKVCSGQEENAECNEQKVCNQGLACLKGVCKNTVSLEQKCENTEECSNEAFCFNQKCVKYGSAQIGDFIEKVDQDTIDLRCQSFLLGKDGKCIDSNTPLAIQSCPSQKKCQNSNELKYRCNLFSTDKTYNKSGGINQSIRLLVQDLSQKIITKNKNCPTNLKLSNQCYLVAQELEELQELKYLYQNLDILMNMNDCLYERLLYKISYDKFVSDIKTLENQPIKDQNEKIDSDKEDNTNTSDASNDSNTELVIVILVIFVFIICVVGGYIILRKRRLLKLQNQFQDSVEVQENTANGKRSSVPKSKDKPNNINASQNKVSLNLEYNPTSGKGENQFDISQLNGQDTNKNAHLETSVHHNFFSIDGDDEKEAKLEDQIEENHTGSDVSYENVFNIEGDNIDQPNSQRKRRRHTNRKKIVKNSEKTYAVVEE